MYFGQVYRQGWVTLILILLEWRGRPRALLLSYTSRLPLNVFLSCILFIYFWGVVWVPQCALRGQCTVSGIGSLFSPRGSLSLNSGVSLSKRSLPPEPFRQPRVLPVCSQLIVTRVFKPFVILVEDNKVILCFLGTSSLFSILSHALTL